MRSKTRVVPGKTLLGAWGIPSGGISPYPVVPTTLAKFQEPIFWLFLSLQFLLVNSCLLMLTRMKLANCNDVNCYSQ